MQVPQHLLVKLDDVGQVAVDRGPEPGGKGWQRSENGDVDLGELNLR